MSDDQKRHDQKRKTTPKTTPKAPAGGYSWQRCYMCKGKRFLAIEPDRHFPCPVCGMDGTLLIKNGEPPPVPGRLVRSVVRFLEEKKGGTSMPNVPPGRRGSSYHTNEGFVALSVSGRNPRADKPASPVGDFPKDIGPSPEEASD